MSQGDNTCICHVVFYLFVIERVIHMSQIVAQLIHQEKKKKEYDSSSQQSMIDDAYETEVFSFSSKGLI